MTMTRKTGTIIQTKAKVTLHLNPDPNPTTLGRGGRALDTNGDQIGGSFVVMVAGGATDHILSNLHTYRKICQHGSRSINLISKCKDTYNKHNLGGWVTYSGYLSSTNPEGMYHARACQCPWPAALRRARGQNIKFGVKGGFQRCNTISLKNVEK